jgi:hypothetical protein
MNAMEVVQRGNVAHNPYLIAVKKHDLSRLFVQVAEIWLIVKLTGVSDARGEIRR